MPFGQNLSTMIKNEEYTDREETQAEAEAEVEAEAEAEEGEGEDMIKKKVK